MTRQANLATRASRAKLRPLARHLAKIAADLFLVYRRPKSGPGTWSLKRYADGAYSLAGLGAVADDMSESDGERTLSFHEATAKARELAKSHAEREKLEAAGPTIDVRRAVEEYAQAREARWVPLGGPKHDARTRLARHVLADGALAATPLALLTVDQLATWRKGAAERVTHDIRAALNAAARRYRDRLPPTLRDVVKDGLASPGAAPRAAHEIQALSDPDVRRLVLAAQEIDAEGQWDGSLYRLVLVLAATGARFSQVARCTVSDVQPAQRRLMIPTSRKGKSDAKAARTAVPIGDDVCKALAPAMAGRLGNEPLFMRPDWRPIGVGKWVKGDLRPWRSPGEFGRPWRLIAERAGLRDATAYSLRHAAIVRSLSLGLPVQLVAKLFDTSALMVQRSYSASIVDALGDLAQRMAVPLAPVAPLPLSAAR